MQEFDPFIKVFPDNLSKEVCDDIIARFIKDTRAYPGITQAGFKPLIKNSLDLNISVLDDWKDIDGILFKALHKALEDYNNHTSKFNAPIVYENHEICDLGFYVKYYIKNNGFYIWHEDNFFMEKRILTYIWYLNDVEEGGETEFLNGKVKPKTGTLVLFPATWTYIHRGNMPISSDKYIITGWISRRLNQKKIL